MAHTLTLLDASALRADILVTEAGTASVLVEHNLATDPAGALAAGGALLAAIGPGATFADTAACQAFLDTSLDVECYLRTASGVTTPRLAITATASAPAVAGNFRLALDVQEAADGDTSTFGLAIKIRHSLTDS